MDCGPAALKCLLEGFGVSASYGRLREACQTDVDGTSINTLEDVAQRLGLQAQQVMAPTDHLLLSSAQLLPALVVTVLPNGFNHFVVVWRVHGPVVQLMDPTSGRRWVNHQRFLAEVYRYSVPFSADSWRAWAETPGFLDPLHQRLTQLELPATTTDALIEEATADISWRGLATLDAATRMVNSVVQAQGVNRGREATHLLEEFFHQARAPQIRPQTIIPEPFWSARALSPAPNGNDTTGQNTTEQTLLLMRGAVLLKVAGLQPTAAAAQPSPHATTETAAIHDDERHNTILETVLSEAPQHPEWEIFRLLRVDGMMEPVVLLSAALLAALGVTVEAALLRGLMVLAADQQLGSGRLVLSGALVAFVLLLLVIEFPLVRGALRLGRRLETRIRIAFLTKIPRLEDRYFHSRLISDMAQRAHGLHQLHALPDLALRLLRLSAQLLFTTIGIIWLYPAAAPLAFLALIGAVAAALVTQPLQSERDLRVRTHTGALSRFYLDALMGLLPIRTHSAERTIRREHEMLLVAWARESLALARIETMTQSLAALLGIGFAISIVLSYIVGHGEASSVLLLLYWSLNLPALGQSLAATTRQYPTIRNNLARILEPLGAPEGQEEGKGETREGKGEETRAERTVGIGIQLAGVTVQIGGHTILEELTLAIQPGEQVAIVGKSGAGKSSLVGLLLGWHRPAQGQFLVDDKPLTGERIQQLRRQTAWVDPSVQLWNRPLQENLYYGNHDSSGQAENGQAVENSTKGSAAEMPAIGLALTGADLYAVLERLPNGLQTRLGEGGGLVSGGEGQRVRLGRALLRRDVRLAILDEPFRGLDRTKRRQLLSNARRHWQSATLLCITHDIAETIDFNRVLVIEDGRLVEDGSPQALLAQPQSRYRALLTADEQVYNQLWRATSWRRLWLERGQLDEEHTHSDAKQAQPVADELRKIKGIGPVWAERLHQIGIYTVTDLARINAVDLKARFTAIGQRAPATLYQWISQAQQRMVERQP